MDKEVEPHVLAVIDEMRLKGPRLTPVEIVAKMGVFDARDKPFDHAWLATGDNVIATIWGEFVSVGSGGRWFCIESLDTQHRVGGGPRNAQQVQRAKDRLALLKRTFDAGQGFRAVLQTNRIAIAELESNKDAKVSTRVRDDDEWHVATWEPEKKLAVLVRGSRGWVPTEADLQAAKARGSVPKVAEPAAAVATGQASPEEVHAAAIEYVTKHFTGYGYKAENVIAQNIGFDLEVSNAKGQTLLRVVVKGTAPGVPSFKLSSEERACSVREPLWRLLVVTDAGSGVAQHKIYKPNEISSAPGYDPS
ncbi:MULTISPECIES: protein NO VEIN domain-containing protein [unclassified Variovorax]|uniref:protein NO VEIN domain-containing protein n=1 Tax=unclassified Variovorax TaxID=663243 RepID=UPI003F46CED5